MFFAALAVAVFYHIFTVFFGGGPSKIDGRIVRLVAVIMSRDVFRTRAQSVKSCADENGYRYRTVDSIPGYTNLEISLITVRRRNAPCRIFYKAASGPIVKAIIWHSTTHATQTTDLIIRPRFHKAPFFGKDIISHLARFLRAFGQGRATRYQRVTCPDFMPKSAKPINAIIESGS